MFCAQCGKEILEDSRFCSECGALVHCIQSSDVNGENQIIQQSISLQKRCINCGREMPDDTTICVYCGQLEKCQQESVVGGGIHIMKKYASKYLLPVKKYIIKYWPPKMKTLIIVILLTCICILLFKLLKSQMLNSDSMYERALAGDAVAQCDLGLKYYNGDGVTQNYRKAVKWWRLSAKQGDATAQSNIGGCYFFGEGVAKNIKKAKKWCLLGAEQQKAYGQFILGKCYEWGQEETDYSEAYYWYLISSTYGNEYAPESADRVAEHLSPQERANIRARALRWVKDHLGLE